MNAQRPKIRYTPLHRAIQRSGTVVAVPVLGGLCIIATRGYDFQIETEEDVASLGERFEPCACRDDRIIGRFAGALSIARGAADYLDWCSASSFEKLAMLVIGPANATGFSNFEFATSAK